MWIDFYDNQIQSQMREPIQTFYDKLETCKPEDIFVRSNVHLRSKMVADKTTAKNIFKRNLNHSNPSTRGKTGEGVATATRRLRFLSARNLYCILTMSFPTFSLVNRKLPSFIPIFAAGCKRHEYFLPIVQNVALCSLCREPNFTR